MLIVTDFKKSRGIGLLTAVLGFSATRCLRLTVRTSPFHGEDRSSILLGTTKYIINHKPDIPCQ